MFQSQSSPHPSGVVCCFSVSHDDPLSFYWTNGLSVVWILNAHNQFLMVSATNLCQGTMAFFPYPCRTDKLGLSHLAHGFSLSETRLCKEISQYPERTRHHLPLHAVFRPRMKLPFADLAWKDVFTTTDVGIPGRQTRFIMIFWRLKLHRWSGCFGPKGWQVWTTCQTKCWTNCALQTMGTGQQWKIMTSYHIHFGPQSLGSQQILSPKQQSRLASPSPHQAPSSKVCWAGLPATRMRAMGCCRMSLRNMAR